MSSSGKELPFDRAQGCRFGHNGPRPMSGQSGGLECMQRLLHSRRPHSDIGCLVWDAMVKTLGALRRPAIVS